VCISTCGHEIRPEEIAKTWLKDTKRIRKEDDFLTSTLITRLGKKRPVPDALINLKCLHYRNFSSVQLLGQFTRLKFVASQSMKSLSVWTDRNYTKNFEFIDNSEFRFWSELAIVIQLRISFHYSSWMLKTKEQTYIQLWLEKNWGFQIVLLKFTQVYYIS